MVAVFRHLYSVTAEDIAEEIVWAASRPPHVNIAEMLVFPVNQASATCESCLGLAFVQHNIAHAHPTVSEL